MTRQMPAGSHSAGSRRAARSASWARSASRRCSCGGPLILSLVASGAVLGGPAAVWADGRLLLIAGIVLVLGAVWLLARRRSFATDQSAACCTTPTPTGGADQQAGSMGLMAPDGQEHEPASISGRNAS
jgi:hypothetical protein